MLHPHNCVHFGLHIRTPPPPPPHARTHAMQYMVRWSQRSAGSPEKRPLTHMSAADMLRLRKQAFGLSLSLKPLSVSLSISLSLTHTHSRSRSPPPPRMQAHAHVYTFAHVLMGCALPLLTAASTVRLYNRSEARQFPSHCSATRLRRRKGSKERIIAQGNFHEHTSRLKRG
jgi:hypothetical protein